MWPLITLWLITIITIPCLVLFLHFLFKAKMSTHNSPELSPSVLEAVEIVNLIEEIRVGEDSYIILLCDNPSCLGPCSAVEIGNTWDGFDNGTRFQGNSLVEALRHAAAACRKHSTK